MHLHVSKEKYELESGTRYVTLLPTWADREYW